MSPHIGNFPIVYCPKPMSIGPPAFVPEADTYGWIIDGGMIQNAAEAVTQYYRAPVFLPSGAKVKKLTWHYYRDEGLGVVRLTLYRVTSAGVETQMAQVEGTGTNGDQSAYDDTIDYPEVDNENYHYNLHVELYAPTVATSAKVRRAIIEWE